MYKQKTQIYVRLENFGMGYFNSIEINNIEKWRDKLPEYLVEKEKYDRWVAMYGTGTYINVVFHNDYCSGRNLVGVAYHIMEMTSRLGHSNLDINPFLRKNWEFGSRNLPGICIYNEPESAIIFLHAYVSGSFSSPLVAYCTTGMPVFDLVNRSIYNDSEGHGGVINRFDELDNNDGILLIDFVSKKHCFMMTDTFDPTNAKVKLEKFVPISSMDYILAFHQEDQIDSTSNVIISKLNIKFNKPFRTAMKKFEVLSVDDIIEWFPEMHERIPVNDRIRLKGLKTPPVFEDAQAMERLYPETFIAPTQNMLERIIVGSLVKVCVRVPHHIQAQRAAAGLQGFISERFWVKVTATDGKIIKGTVNNLTQHVELNNGDTISFEQCNVYQIH